jgi:hypothetical protein
MMKPLFAPVPTEKLLMPPVQGVAPGGKAYLNLPPGFRYRRLHVVYTGTGAGGGAPDMSPALMTAIRLYADNELFQNISGTDRDNLNQFDRFPAADTFKSLCLPFERTWMAEPDARYLTCINTGVASQNSVQAPKGINTLRLEIDIDATAPADTTLTVYADVMDVNVQQSRMLPRIDRWAENVAAVGEFLHVNSAKLLNDPLRPYLARLTFVETIAHLTAVRLRKNNVDIVQTIPVALLQFNQRAEMRRTPMAGYVMLDSGDFGEYFAVWDPIHWAQCEVRTTHTAVNAAMPVIVETFGPAAS